MSVLLAVLKCIGICLAVLCGLLLLLLLLLLLVPIRYRAGGRFEEEKHATAKVSWLLSAVSASLCFHFGVPLEEGLQFDLRLFGISIPEMLARKKEKAALRAEARRQERREEKQARIRKIREEDPVQYDAMRREAAARKEEKARREEEARLLQEEAMREAASSQPAEEPKKTVQERIETLLISAVSVLKKMAAKALDFFLQIVHLPRKLWQGMLNARARLLTFCDKIKEKLRFYMGENMRGMLAVLFFRGKKILRHVLPRRLEGDLRIGFDDPAKTGYLLAATSCMRPRALRRVRLQTNFSEQELAGNIAIKGRVCLGYILVQAAAAVLHKHTRKVYRERKRLKEVA